MFGRRITLFRLLGFEVKLDLSWLLLAALITWSLARSLFPVSVPGQPDAVYWAMGFAGALGLFASIVVHEFSHSLVARRRGLPMKGITLFIFGGVAEMGDEPASARTEFLMAIAGPLSSIALAGLFLGLATVLELARAPDAVVGVLGYLWPINLVLAAFNLVPAFPLDGGRVLRAFLWATTHNLRRATRIASLIGSAFGFALAAIGIVFLFRGDLVTGIWGMLIGSFVHNAAQRSYRQLVARQVLRGEPVRRFMREDPVTAPYHISIAQLVDEIIYRHHHRLYPVMQDETLVGCITTRDVKELPREEWTQHTVKSLSHPCTAENTIGPDVDAADALSQMGRTGNSRLMVVSGDRLVGIVTLKDLLQFLFLKTALEGKDAGTRDRA
ncbi:MAG: site-2 protease family protein [Candidatus Bipolaricaulota bacterium]|nr:MAG: site-2 protease family protein [Candidatus Bipolaricaulota bacterium]